VFAVAAAAVVVVVVVDVLMETKAGAVAWAQ
jgi:hypothetical protein